jgi:uncharacterized RDD family membrane protein YckC
MRSENDTRLEDKITIATPEGVELELTLAGAGSRFVSALADLVIQAGILIALALALGGLDLFGGFTEGQDTLAGAIYALMSFLVVAGYDISFEVLAAGRTPGKRINGLRVVRSGGEPVRFLTSAIRNAVRVVDFLPFAYVVGAVTILATRNNQRLGDLAAGTLVVRERRAATIARSVAAAAPAPVAVSWDTSAVTADETAAVRRFLERRWEIDLSARRELARTFASRLRPKVAGAPAGVGDEEFLTLLVAAKSSRGV